MSYCRLIFCVALLSFGVSVASGSENSDAATCQELLNNTQTISSSLISLLGDWDSCKTTHFKQYEYGADQTLVAQWKDVALTVQYNAPETGIYIVEVKEPNVLTAQWFEKSRDSLIPSFFDIDWETDMFPGPTSEHYVAKDKGTNGQIWIERNTDGSVTWMRFSYAL